MSGSWQAKVSAYHVMANTHTRTSHSHDSLWDERLGKRASFVSTCRLSSVYSSSSRALLIAENNWRLYQ
ncbi:hypothetical protein IGI04_037995 [Brassica rapa subsp. trilocularis]|uniref:Uncharacterized protein n=1 Tax=Brassica rapa subsp. trilocularis TaxID=1813537 RepID=A0ABQ7LKL8_BRACM|nr:hypothetical protein IGI04_037995 [Brassica rapa subsp. trilocularis]